MMMKAKLVVIQCMIVWGMSLLIGCNSGNMVSYTSGPDGKTIKTEYSFVYRDIMIAANGQIGIDVIIDQQEKNYIPLTHELGALPPSDLYSKANIEMRMVNLTDKPLRIAILSYKKPTGKRLVKTSELTIPPEGTHVINFGEIIVGTYSKEIKGIVVEYSCQSIRYTSNINPKRLTLSQWDEYYYAPDRIKAKTAAELFRKMYDIK
jgi:hypothetical protein